MVRIVLLAALLLAPAAASAQSQMSQAAQMHQMDPGPGPAAASARAEAGDGSDLERFRGRIAYFGNYTGRTRIGAVLPGPRPTIPCPFEDHRCAESTVGGSLKVVLTFDGEHVDGFYVSAGGFSGPNGLIHGRFVGRRVRDTCELYEKDGTTWIATVCTRKEFNGQIVSVRGIPKQSDLHFVTTEMFQADDGEFARQRGAAAAYRARIAYLDDARHQLDDPERAVLATVMLDSMAPGGPEGFEGLRENDFDHVDFDGRRRRPHRGEKFRASVAYHSGNRSGTVWVVSDGDAIYGIAWAEHRPDGWGDSRHGEYSDYRPIRMPPPMIDPPSPRDEKGWLNDSAEPFVIADK